MQYVARYAFLCYFFFAKIFICAIFHAFSISAAKTLFFLKIQISSLNNYFGRQSFDDICFNFTHLPNWMKSAMQRVDSWRESLWVNKERPRVPAGGVSCKWKLNEKQDSQSFSKNKERPRTPAGGVSCNWKMDFNKLASSKLRFRVRNYDRPT